MDDLDDLTDVIGEPMHAHRSMLSTVRLPARAWTPASAECGAGDDEDEIAAAVARRRFVLTLSAVGLLGVYGRAPCGPKRLDAAPFSWTEHVRRLDEQAFKLRYRLTPHAFYELLELVGDEIDVKDELKAVNSKGMYVLDLSCVSLASCLYILLICCQLAHIRPEHKLPRIALSG